MRFMANLLGVSQNIQEGLKTFPVVLQFSNFPCQRFSTNVQDLVIHIQEVYYLHPWARSLEKRQPRKGKNRRTADTLSNLLGDFPNL